MKILFAATTASLLMLASPLAMAQTQPAPSTTTPPAATAPKTTTAPAESKLPMWYSHQAGEIRASKLIGSTVRNAANESIGDINEVVLSKDGQVAAVIVGVGGFLGIGEREVAISFDSLRMVADSNQNAVLTVNTTKESLKNAPEWQWTSATNSGTTGTGTTKPN
jgi:hypothetical protein